MLKLETRGWVVPIVICSLVFIFTLDSFTAKGSADYIFYFLPVALASLHNNQSFPFRMGLICTVLAVIGFMLSADSDTDINLAMLNRGYAIFSMWGVAILVRQVIRNRNQVNQNNWNKAKAVELANEIRGEISTKELTSRVLTFLAKNLEYQVAALYMKKEESEEFEYYSGFAYDPSGKNTIILPGQGILGQTIIDQNLNLLSSLPPDHIKIESALGVSSPKHIMALPFTIDNKTIAVAELGFISMPSYDIVDFLKQILEPTAISIRSAQNKEKLSYLLNQSQKYAKELQGQQEELRVINEELEQQSNVLKESHLRLEHQQSEMEQTNQQLEEQTQELETQKKQLDLQNKELEQRSSEIKKASNYKTEFLANMSHELRTPLNSTLILAKLLADNKSKNLTKEQVEYAQIIYHSGNDLLNLINDILDLSKVEAGKMNVNIELVQLTSLAKSIDQIFSPVATQKKLEFKIDIDQNAPSEIFTDRLRLEQIIKNFLSNAFKFTEKGGVTLKLFAKNNKINFSVIDTGLGIGPEEEKIIFEAFRQADGTTNRKFGGTGLGLSISKELARLLGGEINLSSTKGIGSTFTLTLPMKINEFKHHTEAFKPKSTRAEVFDNKEPQKPAGTFTIKDDRENLDHFSRTILIIEDDESFAKVLLDLAHEMSFGAILAESADEGMILAKRMKPHAIVLDVRLPDHNGMIVLDQLKLDANTRHIPVHVISAHDFSRSAMEMGAMGYMLKPVKKEKLQSAFQGMITLLDQSAKHVLIVEDDPTQRRYISELIADDNVEVTAVETSGEALELLSQKTFDCMIMDLALPDMSGHELLAKLSNETFTYSFPPVIVYTARDLTPEEEQMIRLYSGSIIIKGAKSPERLLSEVTLFLHKVEKELPLERQKMLRNLRNKEKNLEDRSILVVDDDVRNIFALTAALEVQGARIFTARNGKEALEKIDPSIDLVLMDIMMPEMDGFEAMSTIRLNEEYKELPIIALTAKAMADDKQKCLEAGANDYLSKPLEVEKLLSLIKIWLPHKRSFS